MVAINRRNPKEGRSQPQFGKKEICAGCPSNAARWARGHLEVIKRTTKPKPPKSEELHGNATRREEGRESTSCRNEQKYEK